MKAAKKIAQGIRQISHTEEAILSAVVVSVDMTAQTMEVRTTMFEDTDSETLTVNLNAVQENGNGVIIYPSVGSNVIIGNIDGPGEYALIRASDIDKALITVGNMIFTMDGNKFGMQIGSESMGKIMGDMIEKVMEMTFTNGGGTTAVSNNVSDLTAIKTRINNFLTA